MATADDTGCLPIYLVDDSDDDRLLIARALRWLPNPIVAFSGGRAFLQHPYDDLGCVVLDLRMPDLDGISVLEVLRSRFSKLSAVVLTAHADIMLAVQAMKLGAVDFVQKSVMTDALPPAVEQALALSSERSSKLRYTGDAQRRLSALTPREQQVLEGLVAGQQNKVIAHELQISPRTIEMYRAKVMSKLKVRSLAEAVRLAHSAGLSSL